MASPESFLSNGHHPDNGKPPSTTEIPPVTLGQGDDAEFADGTYHLKNPTPSQKQLLRQIAKDGDY